MKQRMGFMMHPDKLDQETRDAIQLHDAVEWLPFEWNGPLIRKPDGGLIGVGPGDAFESAKLWLTTMQNGLAVRLRVRDFVA